MISVIIATKNRQTQLRECLLSLAQNAFTNFEIVVADQNTGDKRAAVNQTNETLQIKYVHVSRGGKSAALNSALALARGDIIAFTDDDCIPAQDWLKQTSLIFKKHPTVAAVFGNTLPYIKTRKPNMSCPCIFFDSRFKTYRQPLYHARCLGFGNNMAIRKNALLAVGGFREWLGPGSIGQSAEDAEVANRLLLHKFPVAHNPKMVVYHNRWLNSKDTRKQNATYALAEAASYGYFFFQRYRFAPSVMWNSIRQNSHNMKWIARRFVLLRWDARLLQDTYDMGLNILQVIRGLIIASVYSVMDPIV